MRWARHTFFKCRPILAIPALLGTALWLQVWLRLCLLLRRPQLSQLNRVAIENVNEFVEQYPFHLYPLVCKAFELACLEAALPKPINRGRTVLEIAIGDGTLSARVFPVDANVIGLDLSPYSLKRASEKPHVRQAIVC